MNAPLPPPPARYRASHAAMGPALHAVGLSCRAAYELLIARQDRPLRAREEVRLRLHLLICGVCRRLPAQLAGLRRWLRHHHAVDPSSPAAPPATLSAESRQRIRDRLRDRT
jgi:predicted anti-sigma-YlaC factor YlaD